MSQNTLDLCAAVVASVVSALVFFLGWGFRARVERGIRDEYRALFRDYRLTFPREAQRSRSPRNERPVDRAALPNSGVRVAPALGASTELHHG
ncbi:MAG TPA: hypothetical protein VFX59_06090 [Polyangiales bacterium]|nr:hypothetical protein [Polyangiales bacterium]